MEPEEKKEDYSFKKSEGLSNIKKIIIEVIPHAEQRYPTVGDYMLQDDTLRIKVSQMEDNRYSLLVAVHELVESLQIIHNGKKIEDIDAFDKKFEELRTKHPDIFGTIEPGDMTTAPYNGEHVFATAIEKASAFQLQVPWEHYEETVNSL